MASKDEVASNMSPLVEANNRLAISLHKSLAQEKKNVFFSPFSLSTAMAMLYHGAGGIAAEEMRIALGYKFANIGDEELTSSFQTLLASLEGSQEQYVLSNANSLLCDKNFAVKETYKHVVQTIFNALLLEVDFDNESKGVVDQINEWVKRKTNGMISSLLEYLEPTTVVVILNAIYFKGSWMHQFETKSTVLESFYNNGKKGNAKKVKMMHHHKVSFPVVERETFKALQLPYKGDNVAMIILLPHALDGLDVLEQQLAPSFIQDLKKDMRKRKVLLSLPQFRLEYFRSLKNDFQSLGVNQIFERGADLRGISDCKVMKVSKIYHKAVLEVNEEGSEAAAATAVVIKARCVPVPVKFVANHPFLLAIFDTRSYLILFMGRVEEL